MHKLTRQAGFTLLETTAVIAIVGTLSALALPRYADAIASARVVKMEMARRAVDASAQAYHMKWMLAGSPRVPTAFDGVQLNGRGYPTSEGIVAAAGLADGYDVREPGVIAADAQHPDCSLAYSPDTGTSVVRYADGAGC